MELKFSYVDTATSTLRSSNRTFMELKLAEFTTFA